MDEGKGIGGQWRRKYLLEYAVALAIYLAMTKLCMRLALEAQHSATRVLLLLGPMIGILLMTAAVVRHFLAVDEYLRRTMTEYFAVAGVVAFLCSFAYGFFEEAGFPRISTWWILPVMASGMLFWRGAKALHQR